MSKRKAFWLAVLCTGLCLLFIVWQQLPCLIGAVCLFAVFGGIWLDKHWRDRQYIADAAAARSQAMLAPPTISRVSEGSDHLFVPPARY